MNNPRPRHLTIAVPNPYHSHLQARPAGPASSCCEYRIHTHVAMSGMVPYEYGDNGTVGERVR
eukprot:scaffold84057_cov14-Prasinocladus_malaysianus.AAC.1